MNRNIELIRYRRFGNDLLLFELVNAVTAEGEGVQEATAVSAAGKWKTISETLAGLPGPLKDLYEELRAYLLAQGDDVQEKAVKDYVAFKRLKKLRLQKERLIELLQEKRTALITRAVTKGLDPSVPMKDSGVEWLGEIPSHWKCHALSRVTTSRCDGPFGSGLKSEHYTSAGVRVVRLQNIGWAEFLNEDQAFVDAAYAESLGDHRVVGDDVLIAGLGDEGHAVGRACAAPVGIEPAMVKADCFRFRLDRHHAHPQFVSLQLSVGASAMAGSQATGAIRGRMNLTATARRTVALPPVEEQARIVAQVASTTSTHDALVARVREAIERLKELRTALISAAVTGKIDVRDTA
jgi:type I restriction enzyme S subunit